MYSLTNQIDCRLFLSAEIEAKTLSACFDALCTLLFQPLRPSCTVSLRGAVVVILLLASMTTAEMYQKVFRIF